MAYARDRYTGNGATTGFGITFPVIDNSHVKVYVNGVLQNSGYTVGGGTVVFSTAPANGATVEIVRNSSRGTRLTNFVDAVVITASALNRDSQQALYAAQEALDRAEAALQEEASGGFDAENSRIKNVAAPVDLGDATNLGYVQGLVSQISLTPGPQGPQGEQGPQGLQGLQGPPGDASSEGSDPTKLPIAGGTMAGALVLRTDVPGGDSMTVATAPGVTVGRARISSDELHIDAVGASRDLNFGANSAVRVRVRSNGSLQLVPLSVDPSNGELGDLYFNSNLNRLRFYNGTSWDNLSGSSDNMAIQFSPAVRNARLDAVETAIGTTPSLRIYSGSAPASTEVASTGVLLATIALPSDWMGAAADGVKSKTGSWTTGFSGADNSGVAGYFRVFNSAGSVVHIQGSVSVVGGGGDMALNNITIVAGQPVTISTFQMTELNS